MTAIAIDMFNTKMVFQPIVGVVDDSTVNVVDIVQNILLQGFILLSASEKRAICQITFFYLSAVDDGEDFSEAMIRTLLYHFGNINKIEQRKVDCCIGQQRAAR